MPFPFKIHSLIEDRWFAGDARKRSNGARKFCSNTLVVDYGDNGYVSVEEGLKWVEIRGELVFDGLVRTRNVVLVVGRLGGYPRPLLAVWLSLSSAGSGPEQFFIDEVSYTCDCSPN